MADSHTLQQIYSGRFDEDAERRNALWKVLCRGFFSRWIAADAHVLEVAAGHCEFINNIECASKTAVDLNPDVKTHAASDVTAIVTSSTDLDPIRDASMDVAFVSNFFEHISREDILTTMGQIRRKLRKGGRLLVLQPNIRFCTRDYWQFFDHITPLDDRSLTEALALSGFDVEHTVVRFLPYTTKGKLPASALLARIYLRLPVVWRLLGAQSFVVASPSARHQ
jgi:SAM-dependent methyltransferase